MLKRSHFFFAVYKKMLKSQLICKEIHIFIIIACFARNFFLSLRTLITAYYKLVGKYVSLQNVKKQKIIKTLVVLGHSALEKYVWFVLLFPKQETDGVSNSFFSSMSMYTRRHLSLFYSTWHMIMHQKSGGLLQ